MDLSGFIRHLAKQGVFFIVFPSSNHKFLGIIKEYEFFLKQKAPVWRRDASHFVNLRFISLDWILFYFL